MRCLALIAAVAAADDGAADLSVEPGSSSAIPEGKIEPHFTKFASPHGPTEECHDECHLDSCVNSAAEMCKRAACVATKPSCAGPAAFQAAFVDEVLCSVKDAADKVPCLSHVVGAFRCHGSDGEENDGDEKTDERFAELVASPGGTNRDVWGARGPSTLWAVERLLGTVPQAAPTDFCPEDKTRQCLQVTSPFWKDASCAAAAAVFFEGSGAKEMQQLAQPHYDEEGSTIGAEVARGVREAFADCSGTALDGTATGSAAMGDVPGFTWSARPEEWNEDFQKASRAARSAASCAATCAAVCPGVALSLGPETPEIEDVKDACGQVACLEANADGACKRFIEQNFATLDIVQQMCSTNSAGKFCLAGMVEFAAERRDEEEKMHEQRMKEWEASTAVDGGSSDSDAASGEASAVETPGMRRLMEEMRVPHMEMSEPLMDTMCLNFPPIMQERVCFDALLSAPATLRNNKAATRNSGRYVASAAFPGPKVVAVPDPSGQNSPMEQMDAVFKHCDARGFFVEAIAKCELACPGAEALVTGSAGFHIGRGRAHETCDEFKCFFSNDKCADLRAAASLMTGSFAALCIDSSQEDKTCAMLQHEDTEAQRAMWNSSDPAEPIAKPPSPPKPTSAPTEPIADGRPSSPTPAEDAGADRRLQSIMSDVDSPVGPETMSATEIRMHCRDMPSFTRDPICFAAQHEQYALQIAMKGDRGDAETFRAAERKQHAHCLEHNFFAALTDEEGVCVEACPDVADFVSTPRLTRSSDELCVDGQICLAKTKGATGAACEELAAAVARKCRWSHGEVSLDFTTGELVVQREQQRKWLGVEEMVDDTAARPASSPESDLSEGHVGDVADPTKDIKDVSLSPEDTKQGPPCIPDVLASAIKLGFLGDDCVELPPTLVSDGICWAIAEDVVADAEAFDSAVELCRGGVVDCVKAELTAFAESGGKCADVPSAFIDADCVDKDSAAAVELAACVNKGPVGGAAGASAVLAVVASVVVRLF